MNETVTICIPAWRSAEVLHETMNSALSQTWRNIAIVISVDPSEDDTWKIASAYTKRREVKAVLQPRRLGWVANSNAALGLARSRFAMLLPHDDLLEPGYVSSCMAALQATPGAVLAYSDIVHHDDPALRIAEPSIEGSLDTRIAVMMREHFDAVAFRGVVDRQNAPAFKLPDFALGGYAADTLWIARMICQGPMLRVPEPLYRKQMLPNSTHAFWKKADEAEQDEMWAVHCVELVATIGKTLPGLAWTPALHGAWQYRFMQGPTLRRPGHEPAWFDPARPLAAQLADVYRRACMRTPHYSWQG